MTAAVLLAVIAASRAGRSSADDPGRAAAVGEAPSPAPVQDDGSVPASNEASANGLVGARAPSEWLPEEGTASADVAMDQAHVARDVAVLVVDGGGAPVSRMPVELVGRFAAFGSAPQAVRSATSGPDGTAVFDDSAELVQARFGTSEADRQLGVEQLGVRIALPEPLGEGPPAWPIRWLSEPPSSAQPIVLEAARIGWIDVEFDSEGDRVQRPTWVSWRQEGDSGRGGQQVPPDAGVLRLGPFGLGWTLRLECTRAGRTGSLGTITVTGPSRAGEVVTALMPVAPSRRIVGVAALSNGETLAERTLRFHVGEGERANPPYASTRTDVNGHFELLLAPEHFAYDLTVRVEESEPMPVGVIPLQSFAPLLGDVDVGHVVLEPIAPPQRELAAGTVRDSEGRAVRGAWVLLYDTTSSDDAEPVARGCSDSDGEFQVIGRLAPEVAALAAFVVHEGFLRPEPREIAPGERGLEFTLFPGAALRFGVQVDPVVSGEELVIRFSGADSSRVFSLNEFGARQQGSLEGLKAGVHRVTVELRSTDWVLYEAQSEVSPGLEFELGTVDLRGALQEVELTLFGRDGTLLVATSFSLRDAEGRGHHDLRSSDDGRLRCLVPADVGSLTLRHPDLGEAVVVPGVTAELEFGR